LEVQKFRESNEVEKFQTQLRNLVTDNLVLRNRLTNVELTKGNSPPNEKVRRRKAEAELNKLKKTYKTTVSELSKEAQTKIEDLYSHYKFFRVQMFAIYKVLKNDESYLKVKRPAIHKAFVSLRAALKKQVKVIGSNRMKPAL